MIGSKTQLIAWTGVAGLSAVLLLGVVPGRMLQQEFPSECDFEVLLRPISIPSQWAVDFAALSQDT